MGLAPILVEQIFGIIKELNAAGTTVLLVEQNAGMALEIADRAYVLESGRLVLSGIISERAEEVAEGMKSAGFEAITIRERGGWTAILEKKANQ